MKAIQNMNENSRYQVLIEDMNGKLDAIMEYVQDIPAIKEDVSVLKNDVAVLKTDVAVLKSEMVEVKDEQRLMRMAIMEDSRDVEKIKSIHPGYQHS